MGSMQFRQPSALPAFLVAAQPMRVIPKVKASDFTFDPKFKFKIEGAKPPPAGAKVTSWGRLRPIMLRFASGEIGHQGFRVVGKVIGYRHEICKREHDVHCHTDNWIHERYADRNALVDLQITDIDQPLGSNCKFRHSHSLSDGGLNSPSSSGAKAGGASSSAREGGAA